MELDKKFTYLGCCDSTVLLKETYDSTLKVSIKMLLKLEEYKS
jgi:hypothetical protein